MNLLRRLIFLTILLTVGPAWAEIPTVLTDTIKNGDGVIDIFTDASGAELQDYLQSESGTSTWAWT